MVDQLALPSDVLSYTQDMMMAVIEEDWERLLEMQGEQDQMIRQLFADTARIFSGDEKKDMLEVQRLNQEILSATEAQKFEIADKLRDMKQGKSKAEVYQSV